MHSDLATLENLATKVPYQKLENILKKSRTKTYNTILSKFNAFLKKYQTDFVCSQMHLHNVLDCFCYCPRCDQDCDEPILTFEGYDRKLCISIWFEDIENNDYQSRRLNCIALTQRTISSKGKIRGTRIIRQWNVEFYTINNNKRVQIVTSNSETYDNEYWESQLSLDIIQKAIEFCQYLIGIPLESLSEEEFDKHRQTSLIGIIIEHMYDLHDDFVFLPLYYVKQAMYTLLAIHQFRKDNIVATLPKDIIKLIVNEIWKSRDNPAWTLE